MTGLGRLLDAHLPYPVYLFVGGPVDGQRRNVGLIDYGGEGFIAPDLVEVEELPPAPSISSVGPLPVRLEVKRSTYRFVPARFRNQGHYEWVPQ